VKPTDINRLSFALAACLAFNTGCGKSGADSASAKEPPPVASSAAASPAQKGLAGEVVMDPAAPELKQMTIEAVRAVPVAVDEVTATARIQANPHSVAHAVVPVPGRIVSVMVKLGDTVVKGQPLVAIESSAVAESESAFVQSEASVRQAEIALTKAEADLTRISDLYDHQAVAQKEVLAAQTTAGLTKASVDQARSGRDQARRRLELLGLKAGEFQQRIVVTAPISGKVMEVSVVEGEFRNEINTPLVTITDLRRVWVESEVPESKIRLFRIGGVAQLELIAYPGEVFRAKVTRIADSVDSETRTIKVDAEMENATGKLRPDMFGSLRYSAGDVPSPWIPEAAVVRLNGVDLVFVEKSAGRFLSVPVDLGKLQQSGYPVSKGVKVGDRVVTQGSVYLKAAL
jgi:membrane fusion protein, heavy metal efflux system